MLASAIFNKGDRLSPISLAREKPVSELVGHLEAASTELSKPFGYLFLCLLDI